jgi:DNA-directed RNA polymerase sigma subunit (sigma70/sigma32)
MMSPATIHVRTLEETAAALGLTVATVRKTEIRALAKLRNDSEIRKLAREAGIIREREEECA